MEKSEIKGVDYNNLTREQFEKFYCEDVVRYLKHVQKTKTFRIRDETIAAIEEEDFDGADLLVMGYDKLLGVVKKKGRVERLMRVLSSIGPTDTKIDQVPAHIAFISSSPMNEADTKALDLETEYELMRDLVRNHPVFQLSRWRASVEHIRNAIGSGCFCVHHTGHGDQEEGLHIEGGQASANAEAYLDGESFAEMIRKIPAENRPKVVYLAACYSEVVGEKLVKGGVVRHVVACRKEDVLGDNGAPVFAREFYKRLLGGETVLEAFAQAKRKLREMVRWRIERALSILQDHIPQSSEVRASVMKMASNLEGKEAPYGKKVYNKLFALCSQEKVGLDQETKEEIRRLLGWAFQAEIEEPKYTLLPRTDDGKAHDVKYGFKASTRVEPKTGWIPAPDPFFSRDLVKKRYQVIIRNCRLSIKNDHAVLEKRFATRWTQIVGGTRTGKTALATAVAWRLWHDNDGPNAIFWADLSRSIDEGSVLSAVARSTCSDESRHLVAGDPLHALKKIAESKRILLICDNASSLLRSSKVFREILSISKSLLLLTTSRETMSDRDSKVIKMNPTLTKERFRRLFRAYLLESESVAAEKGLEPYHFSKLFKKEHKVSERIRNPGMCIQMAKVYISRYATFLASPSKTFLVEEVARPVITEAEQKDLELARAETRPLTEFLCAFNITDELEDLMSKYLKGTRAAVVGAFEEWLQNKGSQFFWLCAPAGMGKSVAMALLCERFPEEILAVHFCRHDIEERRGPKQILRSLAHDLALRLGPYREELLRSRKDLKGGMADATVNHIWDQLIVKPLRRAFPTNQPPPSRPIVLLVDALDESKYQDDPKGLLYILRHNLKLLPNWVRFAVSSRPEVKIMEELKAYKPVRIQCDEKQNRDDVRLFVEDKLGGEIGSHLSEKERRKATEVLCTKISGMFLYAARVLDQLDHDKLRGTFKVSDLDDLPANLDEYYEQTFSKAFPFQQSKKEETKENEERLARLHSLHSLLEVVVAGQREFTLAELAELAMPVSATPGNKIEEAFGLLEPLSGLLRRFEGRPQCKVRFNHKSVRDWLTDFEERSDPLLGPDRSVSQRYFISESKGHETLAGRLRHLLPRDSGVAEEEGKENKEGKEGKKDARRSRGAACKGTKPAPDDGLFDYAIQHCGFHALQNLKRRGKGQDHSEGKDQGQEEIIIMQYFTSLRVYEEHLVKFPHRTTGLISLLSEAETAAEAQASSGHPHIKHAELHQFHRWAMACLPEALRQNEPLCIYPLALGFPDTFAPSRIARQTMRAWLSRVPPKYQLKIANKPSGLSPQLLQLKGHIKSVNSAAFSPDGKRVVTAGGGDKTARVWDARSGEQLLVLEGHTDYVISAAFSPDGKRVVTASDDETARVWDVGVNSGGETLLVLEGHISHVSSAAFSPDGKRVVTASFDKTARVWDVGVNSGGGETLLVLKGHTEWVTSAAFSPDGERVVTASLDETARVWDMGVNSGGETLLVLKGHTSTVMSAAFSPDGKRVVTASRDKTARVWDARSGEQLLVLKGHTRDVTSAAFSPDGKRVVTASDGETVRVWDVPGAISSPAEQGEKAEQGEQTEQVRDQRAALGSERDEQEQDLSMTTSRGGVIDTFFLDAIPFPPMGMQLIQRLQI